MKFKIRKELLLFIIIALVSIIGIFLLTRSSYFDFVYEWSKENLAIFFIFLIFVKFLGIIYPPFSGGIITISSSIIIDWWQALLADYLGTVSGGVVNYYIGKKYGIRVIKRIFGGEIADKVMKVKVRKGKEIEGIILARIAFGGTILEAVHYAAGLLNIDLRKYLTGLSISHLMMGIPIFYLFSKAIGEGNIFFLFPVIIIALFILFKFRNRYFE